MESQLREGVLVDLAYAMGQLRRIEDGSECRKAKDCASRALNALERIQGALWLAVEQLERIQGALWLAVEQPAE